MKFRTFRRNYNLSLKEVRELQRHGIIEIFQGAYRGHSMRHSKKVRILSLKRLIEHLCIARHTEPPEHEYEQQPQPMVSYLTKKNITHAPKTHYLKRNKNDWFVNEPIRSLWIINEYISKA
jgi:hypothetical protein